MKHIPTFEDFLNEGFIKAYGDKMKLDDFAKIEVGSEVLYAGATFEVIKNDGVTLQLKPTKGSNGRPTKVNFSMFNQAGAIRESLNEGIPNSELHIYEVSCRDGEGTLKSILEAIKGLGNIGHTFTIVLDPDVKEGLSERTFEWDGDGSDSIAEIKVKQTPVKESSDS